MPGGGAPPPEPGAPKPQGAAGTVEVEDSLQGALDLASTHLEGMIQSGAGVTDDAIPALQKFGALVGQLGSQGMESAGGMASPMAGPGPGPAPTGAPPPMEAM